jgi:cell division protease FtsH
MGMYRKAHLNFGALSQDKSDGRHEVDEETRSIMEAQSERLYGETKAILAQVMPLTEHLVAKLLVVNEMSLEQALIEIRKFEAV